MLIINKTMVHEIGFAKLSVRTIIASPFTANPNNILFGILNIQFLIIKKHRY